MRCARTRLGSNVGSKKKRDEEWSEAKRRCRLDSETLRMAQELGMNPRSLIKNIPNKQQRWKAPVRDWVRDLYLKKFPGTVSPASESDKWRAMSDERDVTAFESAGSARADARNSPITLPDESPRQPRTPNAQRAVRAQQTTEKYQADSCIDDDDLPF